MTDGVQLLSFVRLTAVPDVFFWGAAALILGALLGEAVLRRLAWPRMVGYAVVGLLVAWLGFNLGQPPLWADVRLVVDLALALLLFELGSRVSLRWLRANPALLLTSLAEALVTVIAVYVFLRSVGWSGNLAVTGAVLTMSASGAVVSRMWSELRSAGQVTERMMAFATLNTLYAVLAMELLTGWLHLDVRGDWVQGISRPLYTLAGSGLLAGSLAWAVGLATRRLDLRNENSVLLLLGLIVLALSLSHLWGLSALLVPLLAGVLLRNSSERPRIWPRHFGSAGGVLVLMLFVVVGAACDPRAVIAGLWVAVGLLMVRWLAKFSVLTLTAPLSGIQMQQGAALAMTLMPVSATTLSMLMDLQSTHAELANEVAPVIYASMAVMSVLGPLAVQWGLRSSGECVATSMSSRELV